MQKIELKAEGPVQIDIEGVIQSSLGENWVNVALTIRDKVFILGDMAGGEHNQMREALASLQDGDIIGVEIPDGIEFDEEGFVEQFTIALSKARRAEVEEALKKITQGTDVSGIDVRLLF